MDAIYISGNSFKVLNDRTGEFTTGRRVKMDCGLDGLKYASVVSSSYSAPYTTVVVDESDLTASLTSAWYGVTQAGETGSFPDHTHEGGVEGQGGELDGSGLGLTFLSLPDTPTTYSGAEGLFLRVSTVSGVEFASAATSGIDDHNHAAYVTWDFGSNTITGTGDIYCNDIYTASGTVYIGELKLSTDGTSLLVNDSVLSGRTTYVDFGVPTAENPISAEQYDYYINSDTSNMYEKAGAPTTVFEDDFTGIVLNTGVWSTRQDPDGSVTVNNVLELNNTPDWCYAHAYTNSSFTKSGLIKLTCKWKPHKNLSAAAGDLYPPQIIFRDPSGYSPDGTYGYPQAKCFFVRLGKTQVDTTDRSELSIMQNTTPGNSVVISIDETQWHDFIITINCDTRLFSIDLDAGTYTLSETISQGVWDSIGSFVLEFGTSDYNKTNTEQFDDVVLTTEPVNAWQNLGHTAGTFINLPDTPSTYSGTEGQYLISTGSGTEWATVSGGGDPDAAVAFTDHSDTPNAYDGTDGQFLVSTGSGIVFSDYNISSVDTNLYANELVKTITVSSGIVNTTISGIQGNTYGDWTIDFNLSCPTTVGNKTLDLRYNNDSGSNYNHDWIARNSDVINEGYIIDRVGHQLAFFDPSGTESEIAGVAMLFLDQPRKHYLSTTSMAGNDPSSEYRMIRYQGNWQNITSEVDSITLLTDGIVTGEIKVYKRTNISLPISPGPAEGNWILVREINIDNETFSESIPWDGNTWPRARIESVWSDSPPSIDDIKVRFNNDSANNYKNAYIAQSDEVVSAQDEQSRDHLRYALGSFSGVRQLFAIADLHLATGMPRQFITRDSMSDSSSYGRMISHFGGHWINTTSNITSIDIASTQNATGQIKIYRWRDITDIPVDKGKQSLQVEYATTSGIYINPGNIHMKDSTFGMYDLDTRLEVSFDSLAIDTWYYVYTNVSGSTASLDATNFTVSSGVPTIDYPNMGYYNGDGRCVGFFVTDDSNNMRRYYQAGSRYHFYNDILTSVNWQAIAGSTDYDFYVHTPFGDTLVYMNLYGRGNSVASAGITIGTPGESNQTLWGQSSGNDEDSIYVNNQHPVMCDSNKQLRTNSDNDFVGRYWTLGFQMPNYIYTGA